MSGIGNLLRQLDAIDFIDLISCLHNFAIYILLTTYWSRIEYLMPTNNIISLV